MFYQDYIQAQKYDTGKSVQERSRKKASRESVLLRDFNPPCLRQDYPNGKNSGHGDWNRNGQIDERIQSEPDEQKSECELAYRLRENNEWHRPEIQIPVQVSPIGGHDKPQRYRRSKEKQNGFVRDVKKTGKERSRSNPN